MQCKKKKAEQGVRAEYMTPSFPVIFMFFFFYIYIYVTDNRTKKKKKKRVISFNSQLHFLIIGL
jgi:preprotein translocase subunit YajC